MGHGAKEGFIRIWITELCVSPRVASSTCIWGEMSDLGYYADGSCMRDGVDLGELGCYADGSSMYDGGD